MVEEAERRAARSVRRRPAMLCGGGLGGAGGCRGCVEGRGGEGAGER